MDTSRNDLLGEIAADAALERSDFLVQATDQLRKFLDANKNRISELGGLVLIDEDPDYLSIAPDLTFRSRTRYLDDLTGEWTSETEVIESACRAGRAVQPGRPLSGLRRRRRARPPASKPSRQPRATSWMRRASASTRASRSARPDPYAAAADEWAATQPEPVEVDDDELAAQRLYDLALEFQERSQRSEARLLEQFEDAAPALIEQDRRPDRQRRRRRAADPDRVGRVPGRGPDRGGQRVAAARDRRGARRVLRPDRRVR